MVAARIVFAADEAVIAKPVQLLEQERIVQFLAVGLVARRDAGDLDMADDRHHLAQRHGHVAMHDLAMIDVELQFQVRQAQLAIRFSAKAKSLRK